MLSRRAALDQRGQRSTRCMERNSRTIVKASEAISAMQAMIATRREISLLDGIDRSLPPPEPGSELAERSERPATPPSPITPFRPEDGAERSKAGGEVAIPNRACSASSSSPAASRAIAGQTWARKTRRGAGRADSTDPPSDPPSAPVREMRWPPEPGPSLLLREEVGPPLATSVEPVGELFVAPAVSTTEGKLTSAPGVSTEPLEGRGKGAEREGFGAASGDSTLGGGAVGT
jgi:hypothetical protein